MFIVTMVFMTGLIFAVQQILYQYSFIDPADPMQRNDAPLFYMIRDSYNVSIETPGLTFSRANQSVQELHTWLMTRGMGPYNLELRYNGLADPDLKRANWGTSSPALILDVHLTGPTTDSRATYRFYG